MVRSYFREKEISSFPTIQEDHIPERFFWKDNLFRTSVKRKYGVPCSEKARDLIFATINFNFDFARTTSNVIPKTGQNSFIES